MCVRDEDGWGWGGGGRLLPCDRSRADISVFRLSIWLPCYNMYNMYGIAGSRGGVRETGGSISTKTPSRGIFTAFICPFGEIVT